MEIGSLEQKAKEICPACKNGAGRLVRGVDDEGAEWWHQIDKFSGCCCLASDLREGRTKKE